MDGPVGGQLDPGGGCLSDGLGQAPAGTADGPVLAEARVVAVELGLPSWWLKAQATSYLPAGHDVDATMVLDRPGLTVIAASPAICWP